MNLEVLPTGFDHCEGLRDCRSACYPIVASDDKAVTLHEWSDLPARDHLSLKAGVSPEFSSALRQLVGPLQTATLAILFEPHRPSTYGEYECSMRGNPPPTIAPPAARLKSKPLRGGPEEGPDLTRAAGGAWGCSWVLVTGVASRAFLKGEGLRQTLAEPQAPVWGGVKDGPSSGPPRSGLSLRPRQTGATLAAGVVGRATKRPIGSLRHGALRLSSLRLWEERLSSTPSSWSAQNSQGDTSSSPVTWKSATLRVARRPPLILAMAAIMPSGADIPRPCRTASPMISP